MGALQKCIRFSAWTLLAAVVFFAPRPCFSLTVDEAISLALKRLPSYRATKERERSSHALYQASLSPYLPSLDVSGSRIHESEDLADYATQQFDVTLSYTLFDWGKRKANRSISRYNWESGRESLRNIVLEIAFDVRSAFYTVMANQEILEQRKIQLKDATKDYEVAQGRHELGVARLSDVLQAGVRQEQARFALTEAEGNFQKSLADINSLIGRQLDHPYDAEGRLLQDVTLPPWQVLAGYAVERPEVRQAEYAKSVAENNKKLVNSEFFPLFSFDLSYVYGDFGGEDAGTQEATTAGVFATWNVFELGKFYRRSSTKFDIKAAQEDVDELKRQFLLEVRRTYEDVVTARKNITVAAKQLREAEHNYQQAFGEYKAGKSDILFLVQAERDLANSRVLYIAARHDLAVSKALLERVAGIDSLDAIPDSQ